MDNNTILRSLRYILNVDDSQFTLIFRMIKHDFYIEKVSAYLLQEDQEDFVICDDKIMTVFLDGLILHLRGPREEKQGQKKAATSDALNNNIIFKKIRIAFNLKEDDILKIFSLADFKISKSEVSALFRRKGHRNYKECGDQILRYFLKGLSLYKKSTP